MSDPTDCNHGDGGCQYITTTTTATTAAAADTATITTSTTTTAAATAAAAAVTATITTSTAAAHGAAPECDPETWVGVDTVCENHECQAILATNLPAEQNTCNTFCAAQQTDAFLQGLECVGGWLSSFSEATAKTTAATKTTEIQISTKKRNRGNRDRDRLWDDSQKAPQRRAFHIDETTKGVDPVTSQQGRCNGARDPDDCLTKFGAGRCLEKSGGMDARLTRQQCPVMCNSCITTVSSTTTSTTITTTTIITTNTASFPASNKGKCDSDGSNQAIASDRTGCNFMFQAGGGDAHVICQCSVKNQQPADAATGIASNTNGSSTGASNTSPMPTVFTTIILPILACIAVVLIAVYCYKLKGNAQPNAIMLARMAAQQQAEHTAQNGAFNPVVANTYGVAGADGYLTVASTANHHDSRNDNSHEGSRRDTISTFQAGVLYAIPVDGGSSAPGDHAVVTGVLADASRVATGNGSATLAHDNAYTIAEGAVDPLVRADHNVVENNIVPNSTDGNGHGRTTEGVMSAYGLPLTSAEGEMPAYGLPLTSAGAGSIRGRNSARGNQTEEEDMPAYGAPLTSTPGALGHTNGSNAHSHYYDADPVPSVEQQYAEPLSEA